MDKQVLSSFKFNDYKIDNISYKFNRNYDPNNHVELDYKLTVNIKIHDDHHVAETNLKLFVGNESDDNPYVLEVSITGLFSTDDEISEEKYMKFCKLNATSILYPYLRSAITDITKIANIGTIILPLVNVHGLIVESEKNASN